MRFWASAILIAANLLTTQLASALEVAGGVVGAEEGDDRYRPASAFHLGFSDSVFMRTYMYGRKFGPFTERTSVLSLNKRFGLFSSKTLSANLGITTLLEQTMYKAQNDSEKDEQTSQFNAGACFGVAYTAPFKNFYFSFLWDSHLYLAGSAGLFLVTGRKHMIGPAFGWRF